MQWVSGITILFHNINSITNVKLQHLHDVAAGMNCTALMILCLQETKLLRWLHRLGIQ